MSHSDWNSEKQQHNQAASSAARLAELIKQQSLTDSIQFLEQRGICSEEAQVFLLSAIGGKCK
jgi:hypothetical protein